MVISATFVSRFIRDLSALGVEVWLDGGWGVDALLMAQTRPHNDVDIVVEEKDLQKVVNMLEASGYASVPKPDSRAWNFVMGDVHGREIDFHVVVFDDAGNGIYGPHGNEDPYPAEAFSGQGVVDGLAVKCTSAASQIASRQGYALRDKDHQDIRLLRAKFGIA